MSSPRTLMGDYVWELCDIKSLDERFTLLENYIEKLGFDSAIYTFVPTIKVGQKHLPSSIFYTQHFSKSFLSDYISEQWDQDDFTVRHIKQQKMDIMDWQQFANNGSLPEKEKTLITRAKEDYGLTNALSIPLMCGGLGGAGVSVISSENNIVFPKLKHERLEVLTKFVQVFHQMSLQEVDQLPLKELTYLTKLKPKQITVLRHLATNQLLKNITDSSDDISSYKAATKVLDKVRHDLSEEFGAYVTRDHMMYLIGLLDILSLYTDKHAFNA